VFISAQAKVRKLLKYFLFEYRYTLAITHLLSPLTTEVC